MNKKKNRKISIITVNLNNKAGLKKTIESVTAQTFQDYEYIVIDGNSTDGSMDVIQQYRDKIAFCISEPDSGVYNAMNKGIRNATGEYCLFLNSGDFFYKDNVLEKIFSVSRSEDIIYGDMMINWGNNKITRGKMPGKITLQQMVNDTLWHPVSFIKRNLFDKYGLYNEDYKIVADYDFFFKTIIIKKVSTRHVHVVISVFDNTNGLSSNPANIELLKKEREKVQKSYPPFKNTADYKKINIPISGVFFKWLKNRVRSYGR